MAIGTGSWWPGRVAPLEKLLGWTNPLRTPGGTILALKGQGADEEVDTARDLLAKLKLGAEILTVRAHPEADDATVVVLRPGLGERRLFRSSIRLRRARCFPGCVCPR